MAGTIVRTEHSEAYATRPAISGVLWVWLGGVRGHLVAGRSGSTSVFVRAESPVARRHATQTRSEISKRMQRLDPCRASLYQ